MPKLAGYAELLLRPGGAGRAALLRCMGQEVVLGLLLDSVSALERTSTVLRLVTTRPGSWAPQHRDARAITWPEASRRFGLHMVVGLALGLCFAEGGDVALLMALPVCAGLILAVPLSIITAQTIGVADSTAVAEVDIR